MSFWKKLFRSSESPPKMIDPDFGPITYDGPSSNDGIGIWQMDSDWDIPEHSAKLVCSSIPSTFAGPFPESREFLLAKKHNCAAIWKLANKQLISIRGKWAAVREHESVTDTFFLSSVGLEHPFTSPPTWDVSFESRGHPWLFVVLNMHGDEIESHRVDT